MLALREDFLAGGLGLRVPCTINGHAHEILLRQRMRFNRCMILLQPAKETLIPFNLLREVLQQPVFQPVLLALVIRLHQAKTGHIHVQVMR